MTLGEKIKALRDTKNISRIRMADLCDSSDAVMAKVESGKTIPSPEFLRKIAEVLGTTPEDLLDEGDVAMGTCLYCGQSMIFEGVHATQEELNMMATQQCNCEEDKERERLRRIEAAINNVENLFDEMPEARDLVKKAIPALVDFALKKVTISDGEVTASAWRDANGKVTVENRRTIIDQADSE